MTRFRLLHASDLHFGRVPRQIGLPDMRYAWANRINGIPATVSSHNELYADAFAAFVQANQAGIDAIVISGDLATTGDPADLRRAHRFIASPAATGYLNAANAPTLCAANKPILLIPGNHDRFGRFHSPGRMAFDGAFGKKWQARQGAQLLGEVPRGDDWLILLGVDLTLRKSDVGNFFCGLPLLGYLGQGRAYPRRIRALRRATQRARGRHPEAVILWVVHFEPNAVDSSLALLDDHELADALNEETVAAVLCGHTHVSNINKTFAGTPVFVCGTTTQHASATGNCFNILDVDIDPSGRPTFACTVVRYDRGSGQFQ